MKSSYFYTLNRFFFLYDSSAIDIFSILLMFTFVVVDSYEEGKKIIGNLLNNFDVSLVSFYRMHAYKHILFHTHRNSRTNTANQIKKNSTEEKDKNQNKAQKISNKKEHRKQSKQMSCYSIDVTKYTKKKSMKI